MNWLALKNECDASGNLTDLALALDAIRDQGCDCGTDEPGTCIGHVCERALRTEREARDAAIRERDEAHELLSKETDRLEERIKELREERDEARDCGQHGAVCKFAYGCQWHWRERHQELVEERNDAIRILSEVLVRDGSSILALANDAAHTIRDHRALVSAIEVPDAAIAAAKSARWHDYHTAALAALHSLAETLPAMVLRASEMADQAEEAWEAQQRAGTPGAGG